MRLATDKTEYVNDIADVIRLFVPGEAVELADAYTPADVVVRLTVSENEFIANASVKKDGEASSYVQTMPYRGGSELLKKRFAKRCIKIAAFRAMKAAFPNAAVPWGSLTGIRPTRMLRELIDTEGEANAIRIMTDEFDVLPQKMELASRIVSVQRPIIDSVTPRDFDVYVGIPFCRTRCLYCSFASDIRTKKTDMEAYLTALMRDISMGAAMVRELNMRPRAFYIGGGTPTILTVGELRELLCHITSEYDTKGKEFTVEAGRPDTITRDKLMVMRDVGVNRISVNPQTMCDRTLRLVGRDHTSEDIVRCYDMVREAGFECINTDVIAGLPNETAGNMRYTLERIAELDPECLTVHTLAIKRSSRLHEHMEEYSLPDIATVEAMTELGAQAAHELGMIPYYMYRQKYMTGNLENVGYAKPDGICVYNIDMMEDALSIMAHGAGSMTKRVFGEGGRIERVPNPKDVVTYISKLDTVNVQRRKLFFE